MDKKFAKMAAGNVQMNAARLMKDPTDEHALKVMKQETVSFEYFLALPDPTPTFAVGDEVKVLLTGEIGKVVWFEECERVRDPYTVRITTEREVVFTADELGAINEA